MLPLKVLWGNTGAQKLMWTNEGAAIYQNTQVKDV